MTRKEAVAILEEVKTIDDSIYQFSLNYMNALEMAIQALQTEPKADWIAADPNNLPDNKVIYELTDGRKGIGVLFEHEFPYDGLSVCAMDEISGKRYPFVGRWMPLPWEEGE